MKVVIGSDHAGYHLKSLILPSLEEAGHEVIDCGVASEQEVTDYPDIAEKIARQILLKDNEPILGMALCGTGIGIAIAANKIPGIRAAVCHDVYTAGLSREHNDANILALGARVIGSGLALAIVEVFLNTDFAGGRHQIRLDKIKQIEKTYSERG